MQLEAILKSAFEHEASDIHLVSGHPPIVRINTVITPMDHPVLRADELLKLLESMVAPQLFEAFQSNKDVDFSYEADGLARYRVNAHMQRGSVGMALRMIKTKIPPLEKLGLPEASAFSSPSPASTSARRATCWSAPR